MESIAKLKNIHFSYGSSSVLHGVSLELYKGEILGLVGESGSGKTTLAKILAGLLDPAEGGVLLNAAGPSEDEGWISLTKKRSRRLRRTMQMVFQDPESSLNPKHKTGRILEDAVMHHMDYFMEKYGELKGSSHAVKKEFAHEQAAALLRRMELPDGSMSRYPRSFSGGEKQRIALARALCVEPALLIADEPTSSLDAPVQKNMLALLKELAGELNLSVLFITHDLGAVYFLCGRVAVMKDGRIIEEAKSADFFSHQETAYARELLQAAL